MILKLVSLFIIKVKVFSNVIVDFKANSFFYGGARGVIVIVVGNEHGDTSSNPGRD